MPYTTPAGSKVGAARHPSSPSSYASCSSTKKPAPGEQPRPAADVLLPEPAVVARLAERHGDEEAPGRPQDPAKLAQRSSAARLVCVSLDAVDLVVGADVLERRDEQDLVERAIGKGQRARVGHDRLEAGNLGLGEIGADELAGVGLDESGDVGGLGEGVADLEHAAGSNAREHPGHLDETLVRSGRRLQVAWPLTAGPGATCEGDHVVELSHTLELGRGGELVEERRARHGPLGEPGERPLARLCLGRAPQHERKRRIDELVVRRLPDRQVLAQPWVDPAHTTRSSPDDRLKPVAARRPASAGRPGSRSYPRRRRVRARSSSPETSSRIAVSHAPDRVRQHATEGENAEQELDGVTARLVDLGEHGTRVRDPAAGREPRAVHLVREDAGGDVERDELAAVRGIDRDADVDRAPDIALHLLIDLESVEPLRDAVARNDG